MTLHEELYAMREERAHVETLISMASNAQTARNLERKLSAIDRSIDRLIDHMQGRRHEGIIS